MKGLVLTCAAAILAVAAAGCGASPRVQTTGVTGAVAFSRCMRSNGVASFPDPSSSGAIPKVGLQHLGVSAARFQSAQRACQHLLPTPSTAQQRLVGEQSLKFSQCVRRHGVPGFPDPDSTGRIPDPASVGIDQGSRLFQSANNACRRYRPPYIPSNAAYDQFARTHG